MLDMKFARIDWQGLRPPPAEGAPDSIGRATTDDTDRLYPMADEHRQAGRPQLATVRLETMENVTVVSPPGKGVTVTANIGTTCRLLSGRPLGSERRSG